MSFSAASKRLIATMICAGLILSVVLALRPLTSDGVPENRFWQQKLRYETGVDLVAAGDSRVLYDVCPSELTGAKVRKAKNFGFKSAPLNETYLSAAVKQLAPDGERILLVGVTPMAFTPASVQSNGFEQSLEDQESYLFEPPAFWSNLENRLTPLSLAELSMIVRRRRSPKLETFSADGWVACKTRKLNESYAIPFYRVRFQENEVNSDEIANLLDRVRSLKSEGVKVFGFQPPVPDEMKVVENEGSGFSYPDFVSEFREAGGVWIEPDTSDCKTYDGSHLEAESARRFSARLAEHIRMQISETKTPEN